jgi:hypothetical protein
MRNQSPNEKAADQGDFLGTAKTSSRKYSRKSTATIAQTNKLRGLLRLRPHHTYELRKQGISHPAGRVNDLEDMGCVIDSDRITTVDGDGFSHVGVAIYTLISESGESMAEQVAA